MTTNGDHPKLAAFTRRLRWALAAIPEADRESIVAEMRSHVLDRIDAGASVDDVLAALGAPDEYAREFRESYAVASALSSRRTPPMLHALVLRAAGSLSAVLAFFVIVIAWASALLVAYAALLKISDPTHVGLWRGERFFFIGIIDDPTAGQELLGPWIMPLALVCVIAAWLVTRSLAVWALKRLAPRA
jgi:hypothetical protein